MFVHQALVFMFCTPEQYLLPTDTQHGWHKDSFSGKFEIKGAKVKQNKQQQAFVQNIIHKGSQSFHSQTDLHLLLQIKSLQVKYIFCKYSQCKETLVRIPLSPCGYRFTIYIYENLSSVKFKRWMKHRTLITQMLIIHS